jgi:hypothetical protein
VKKISQLTLARRQFSHSSAVASKIPRVPSLSPKPPSMKERYWFHDLGTGTSVALGSTWTSIRHKLSNIYVLTTA